MSNNFYRAFEERYRGTRELIAQRLKVYDSFTVPLAAAYPDAVTLDLGCGRGEWLELAASHGFDAFGVDLDEGMLAACRERGLHVKTADALTTLRERADASVALISAFHLVEHLPFELVQELVLEAQRVLMPGGLLIMETPNAENLMVGTNNFYLDPSHVKPIPALLLGFVADFSGFARHVVVRLHGEPVPGPGAAVGLLSVLYGVSLDYAIVAQKQADAPLMGTFDNAFATRYGIGIEDMAAHFDQSTLGALALADSRARRVEELDLQAREHGHAVSNLDEALRHVSVEFDQRLSNLEATDVDGRIKEMEAVVHRLHEKMQADMALQSTLQMVAMEKRMDAALDEIDARSARRASEAEERRLQREHLLLRRIDALEEQMEQADSRMAPLTRRLTTTQLELRDASRQVTEIQRQADHARWRLSTTEEELRQQRARAEQAEAQLHALHQQLLGLVYSTSWRLTAPLRVVNSYSQRARSAVREGRIISGILRRLGAGPAPVPAAPGAAPAGAPEQKTGSFRALQKRIKHSTMARRIALPLLRRFPGLEGPLRRLSDANLPPPPPPSAGPAPLQGPDVDILLPHNFAALPESSREVLLDLARAGMTPTSHQP